MRWDHIFRGLAEDALQLRLPRLIQEWKLDFQDPALLAQALTHSSYCHENPGSWPSNERLEFLGDSVLGLSVSQALMQRGRRWSEGELSRLKSYFVSEVTLAEKARNAGIGQCLKLGKGERASGGCDREAALADAVEAIIGAVFLDRGFEAADRLVCESVLPELSLENAAWESLAASLLEKDSKSKLQEFLQQEGLGTPRYVCTNAEAASSVGPFEMALFIGDVQMDTQSAPSKKEATLLLARRLLAMAPQDLVRFVATRLKQKGFMNSGDSI